MIDIRITREAVLSLAEQVGLHFSELDKDYCAALGLEPGILGRLSDVGIEDIENLTLLASVAIVQTLSSQGLLKDTVNINKWVASTCKTDGTI